MNKETIIRKLTSRKLWLALAAFVSGILTALGHKDTAVTVTGLIMQGAAVISYIIAEGLIDAANKPSDSDESTIEYCYLDENGIPVDGHYTLIHNAEEEDPVADYPDEGGEDDA